VELPRKNHRTVCQPCEAKKDAEREAARFAAAEKISEWDGWIYCESPQGYNDGYFSGVSDLEDYISDNTPDAEEMAELDEEERADIPKMPAYVWTCDEDCFATVSLEGIMENIADNGYEDFDTADLSGTEELGAAIEIFNTANRGVVSYSPNYKKALILGMNSGIRMTCRSDIRRRSRSTLA
jgi:hypothetical protein